MEASRTGNVEAMKVLLDHGADVNAKKPARNDTPLMWAADEAPRPGDSTSDPAWRRYQGPVESAPRGRGPALGKSNDPRKAGRGAGRGAGRRARPRLALAAATEVRQDNAAGQSRRRQRQRTRRGAQAEAEAQAAAAAAAIRRPPATTPPTLSGRELRRMMAAN